MSAQVNYPQPGCIVEYMEDNTPHIAMVMEEASGKLRLLLPGRRETKLAPNRLLPWLGPLYPANITKNDADRVLCDHKKRREDLSASVPLMDLWELAQGEITQAPASWFAELFETDPDQDKIAAYGRAMLGCKTHFRFLPPEFAVQDAEVAAKRLEEQRLKSEREELLAQGVAFLRMLWDVACKRRVLPPEGDNIWPRPDLSERIHRILMARMANPESVEDEQLWHSLTKGLPEVPHLAVQLLMAWGLLPEHYNFWLDRAEYAATDDWWQPFADTVSMLAQNGHIPRDLPACHLKFISIDGPTTRDIDDAFAIEATENGVRLTLAFACPACSWPFDSGLDKLVLQRATSIYLPEGDLHMLPEILGTDAFSLLADEERPALCLSIELDQKGHVIQFRPFAAAVRLAANLRYEEVQQVLEAQQNGEALPDNPAAAHAQTLALAHALSLKREACRIDNGAIVMLRPEPHLHLEETADGINVLMEHDKPARDAQRLVSEMMILAGAGLAQWAAEHKVPLIHRTQDTVVPPEYAGIWKNPADLAKIMRSLIPSILETQPRPHAALGLNGYAPATSPLRRYSDLVNEAQVLAWLNTGRPRWDTGQLGELLEKISSALEGSGQVQRYRPRYWKLLYFRQAGESKWWDGIVTDENETMVTVSLPEENLFVRARRSIFGERIQPGMPVRLRLGKIHPLLNEIQILEALPAE